MVSILINVIQHEQYFFLFWHKFLLSAVTSQSDATSCLNPMSHHWINNKCNRVKRKALKIYALIYALHNFLLYINTLPVFRSNHQGSWKFHKFHRKTPMLESLFFFKIMKLYKDICSAWIRHTFAKTFSS